MHGKENVSILGRKMLFYCEGKYCAILKENVYCVIRLYQTKYCLALTKYTGTD